MMLSEKKSKAKQSFLLMRMGCGCRYQLGEGITKKETDLAQDVQEQQQALQAKAAQKKEEPAEAAPEPQQPQQPAVKVCNAIFFL